MSELITLQHEGAVSTVTYTNPPFNLLDIEVMDALVAAHREADQNPETRVIVTRSGLEGMFSNGLNPMVVINMSEDERVDMFRAVGRLVHGIYSLKKPHITVCNGPAMAGGAVWAILSDWRYMDADRGRISFAESKVGVPVPEGLINIIRAVCLPSALTDVVLMAKNVPAPEAKALGLVDEIAPADQLDALVSKQCQRIARLSPQVLAATKHGLRARVLRETEHMLAATDSDFDRFVGPEFLGEGLNAFMEGRPPVFTK